MQTSTLSIYQALKSFCTNLKYVEKGVTTHYTNYCCIKYPKLQAKYSLDQMRSQKSQKNLQRSTTQDIISKTEPISERYSW